MNGEPLPVEVAEEEKEMPDIVFGVIYTQDYRVATTDDAFADTLFL